MAAVKLLLILAVMLFLAYPLLPLSKKLRKLSTFHGLRYKGKHSKKNIVFVGLVLVEFLLLAFLFGLLNSIGAWIANIPFVQSLFAKLSAQVQFDVHVVVSVVLVNLLVLYLFVIVKALLKKFVFDILFGMKSEKKKGKKEEEESTPEEPIPADDEEIPTLDHSHGDDEVEGEPVREEGEAAKTEKKNKSPSYLMRRILSLFYEGENMEFARHWVHRVTRVLQYFIFFTEILYALVFMFMLIGVFFPGPEWMYKILNFFTAKMYIYPFISLIFLQEICNTLSAPLKEAAAEEDDGEEAPVEEEEETPKDSRLEKLMRRMLRRYGAQHSIRIFPAKRKKAEEEYKITSKPNEVALNFIKNEMERSTGRVVQRYIEGIDALFNNRHIYFGASFYSDLGDYLIAYTYVRLLAGERQIFVVSQRDRIDSLKKYISTRLAELTGCTEHTSWRVQAYDNNNLDTVDVLITCPDDFREDDIVERNASFFEECCNAIFVDADKVFALDSYLCPILSSRLQESTDGRIRYVFLARDVLQGFSAGLKRYFCIDEVVDYSNFEENESVDCFLWNRETRRNRTYTREERLTSIEGKIAEEAVRVGVDGVRILTGEAIDLTEKMALLDRKVEINDFYKTTPEINYLICTDDRYNLSSAIHAFTRFRGKKASVLNLISKPYLLREFFLSHIDRYINRTSFIRPWATESVSVKKLSLIRVFCEATSDEGMPRNVFIARMEDLVKTEGERTVMPVCPFCRSLEEKYKRDGGLEVEDYAAYLIAGLCDKADTPESRSVGVFAGDYYNFAFPEDDENLYSFTKEPLIRFTRIADVFNLLLEDTRRVELRLNDRTLSYLDTVPSRVYQQYLPGQNLVHDHMEYEIERISDDRRVIYLRQENVSDNHMLETIPLRRYVIEDVRSGGSDGMVTFTDGPMASITLSRHFAKITGITFGYHTLESDSQYLDFKKKLRGRLEIEDEIVRKQTRSFAEGRMMVLTIKARQNSKYPDNPCNDKVRMLFAAVFNEFIRTLFPDAYRCIAVCPVLEEPLTYKSGADIKDFTSLVETVYPFLSVPTGEDGAPLAGLTTASDEVRIVFINDCVDDVGVLDHLFDYRAAFMQQFLTNIYAYFCWVKNNEELPTGKHYIYFGGKKLPSVYDIDNCIKLLKGCNRIFSDGKDDHAVADEDGSDSVREEKKCAFCHARLEVGRYFTFAPGRYICMDCQSTTVRTDGELSGVYDKVKRYLKEKYPEETIRDDMTVKVDGVYDLKPDQLLSQYSYRIDRTERVIYVEKDLPETNAALALLQGILNFWQSDNELEIPYAKAQMYREEYLYLMELKKGKMIHWLEETLSSDVRVKIDDIDRYVESNDLSVFESDGTDGASDGTDGTDGTPDGTDGTPDGTDGTPDGTDGTSDGASGDDLSPMDDGDTTADGAEDEGSVEDEDGAEAEEVYALKHHKVDDRTGFSFMRLISRLKRRDGGGGFDGYGVAGDDSDYSLYEPAKIPRFWKHYLLGDKASGSVDETPFDATDATEDAADSTDGTPDGSADPVGDGSSDKGTTGGDKKRKKTKSGLPILPHESAEDTNPRIAVYNDIVRRACDFSNDPIPLRGISIDEFTRIRLLVASDYPELFWLNAGGYAYDEDGNYGLCYRCSVDNIVDERQVKQKMKELKSAAKPFVRGISKRTDPYQALLTIYRRLLLTLVYDGTEIRGGIAASDFKSDDFLRSLHSALVSHKVVCAGYAVSLQYLLQMIGLPSAYVISEDGPDCCHAVTAVKIGKERYYLDPTWDDAGTADQKVNYRFCCVPFREFIATDSPSEAVYHTPRREIYHGIEEFKDTRYEYHRYHGLYFESYHEDKMVSAFANYVKNYNAKEMGKFHIPLRFSDTETRDYVLEKLLHGELVAILTKVKAMLNKKQAALLEGCRIEGYNPGGHYPGFSIGFS